MASGFDPALLDPAILAKLSVKELKVLIWQFKWAQTKRDKQTPPPGDWTEWGILAGRGFGKTLCGGQWLGWETYDDPEANASGVIAPTLNDVRYTCFEGPTGLLAMLPQEIILDYNKTNLILTIETRTGKPAVIRGFSAEEPERLRGPQYARVWCDEIAAWKEDQETWDMMMMGLRLGPLPQVLWTTTPKPKEFIRKLVAPKAGRVITSGSTYENRANLPQSFFDQLAQYEGTQLGRQELEGEIIDAEEGGIIARKWFKMWPHNRPIPHIEFLLVSLDTAFTEKTLDRKSHDPDPTGAITLGAFWNAETERMEALVLDAWDDHLGFPDLVERAKKEMGVAYGDDSYARPMFKPLIGPKRVQAAGRKPDILLIEDKGSGISLRQALEREGVPAYPYNPGRADKTARLHMVSHLIKMGLVWVPESGKRPGKYASWAEPMVAQISSFRGPKSVKHDEYVDCMSQGLRLLAEKGILTGIKITKEKQARQRDEEEAVAMKRKAVGNPYAA